MLACIRMQGFAAGLLWLLGMLLLPFASAAAADGFAIDEQKTRLVITHATRPVAEFVYSDEHIWRPYFANLHVPGGVKVTRNHPPVAGKDAVDHEAMHPGVWLGFGDINGEDFWRNKGRIEHVRFSDPPVVRDDELRFTEESRLLTAEGQPLAGLLSRVRLANHAAGWMLTWDTELHATQRELVFGDQEEMGLGARLATPVTEKAGGQITNSAGERSAKETWGKQAAWCDYSGKLDGRTVGICILPDARNPQRCWWHNRDYGVFVANPFGQRAGYPDGKFIVKKGDTLRLRFHVLLHSGSVSPDFDTIAKELPQK